MRRIPLLLTLLPLAVLGQQYGRPPDPGLGAVDINSAFKLPALRDTDGSPLQITVSSLQVGRRAKNLGLSGASSIDAWTAAQTLLANTPAPLTSRILAQNNPVVFNGGAASALNRLLAAPKSANIKVTSDLIQVDQPIEIQSNGVTLDLGAAQLVSSNTQPYMLRIERAVNVTVLNGVFSGGDSAILVNASSGITLTRIQIQGLSGAGIVVTGSAAVNVVGNQISGVGLAAVMLHRATTQSLVQNNQISGDLGASNMAAAIVLTDREVDLTSNPRAIFGPNGYWVIEQPIVERLNPPHDNLVVGNKVSRNGASGIYVDGGVRNVIASNALVSNAKEGLCLDNGATANVVTLNVVEGNGDRWGEPDSVLAHDFITLGGRLLDGTPAEKVPGVSIDNALYNIVFANSIAHNYGGGVKIVRTGYFNLIGLNSILADNDGMSDSQHFFGVELGSAPADDAEPDLDFTPSRGNIVFSNSIRGTHYSGIFIDTDSDRNDIIDNVILDAYKWALESAKQMPNNALNNLTDLPSRNIGSGLDPALVTSGQPVNDPPPPPPM